MRAAAIFLTGILSFWGGWATRAWDPSMWNDITIPVTGLSVLIVVVIVFAHASHEKD